MSDVKFRLVDLGAIDAHGLNDNDVVVGSRFVPSASRMLPPTEAPVVWQSGRVTQLSWPKAGWITSPAEGGTSGFAQAVNNQGTVVGEAGPGIGSGLRTTYGIVWKRNAAPRSELAGPYGHYNGLNQLGNIVGSDGDRGFAYIGGFKRVVGVLSRLPTGNGSTATAINDRDEVVGCSTYGDRRTAHAFLLRNGRMSDLGGTAGEMETAAMPTAINDRGEIVGFSAVLGNAHPLSVAQPQRALVWRHGHLRRLRSLRRAHAAAALAINNSGWIVGWSELRPPAWRHATLWIADRAMDLNDVTAKRGGWTLTEAVAINRYGHIVCAGRRDGEGHAFLLIPAARHEPSTSKSNPQ